MILAPPFRAALRALKSVGLASLVLVLLAATGHGVAALRAGSTTVDPAAASIDALANHGVPPLVQERQTLGARPVAVLDCEKVDEQLDDGLAWAVVLDLALWSSAGPRTVACLRWEETRIGATHVVLRALPVRGPPA